MSRKCLVLSAIVLLLAPALLSAQMPRDTSRHRAPQERAGRILIQTFATADKRSQPLGAKAAEEMRDQVADAFSPRTLYVIPFDSMYCCSLEETPFRSPPEVLETYDAKALSMMLRADEYVMGSIETTSTGGFRARADLVLTRDINARQPLGVGESRTLSGAMKVLVRELKEARKQLVDEERCANTGREGKYAAAVEYARAAIASYPKATLARMCLLSALVGAKASSDSIVKVGGELLALDPRNSLALQYMASEHRRRNPPDSLAAGASVDRPR